MPSSGAQGSNPFVAGNVVFRPAGFTGVVTTDWTSVPYCNDDFADYGDFATDHFADIHDLTRGIGDICRYMGVIDGANWRMPTAAEWDLLYREQKKEGEATIPPGNGGWVDGSFTPLSGYAFGAHQSNVRIVSDAEVANANPYINGTVFFPTSGYRTYTNGSIWQIGLHGLYWASTASTVSYGYNMLFNSTSVYPQWTNPRDYAFPIRCIRE